MLSTLAVMAFSLASSDGSPIRRLEVEPAKVRLLGSDTSAQIVTTGMGDGGASRDLTREASYTSVDPKVAEIGPDGLIRPKGEGHTTVRISAGGQESTVDVEVEDFANKRPIAFSSEVVPIFTRHGCNAGGCHGKAIGQNGFKLSLLGFDPRADWEVLVREGRGRRVFPAAPEVSLLLSKATARVPHAGGRKFLDGSPEYNTIYRWIAQGARFDTGKEPKLAGIAVWPSQRVVAPGSRQQLRVTASYDDGETLDVTRLARFHSNSPDLASVDDSGEVKTLDGVGEAAVMVRFGGLVTVSRALIPLGKDVAAWEPPASSNLIDGPIFRRLKELGLPPSAECSDVEFARRASLDICGILPAPDDVARFEADTDPEKRARFVDGLLSRPEYADFFAMKWSAILRNQRGQNIFAQQGGNNGQAITFAFHAWVREAIAENRPYDQFATDLIAAKGDPVANPAASWYRTRDFMADEEKQLKEHVDDTAQLFLGMRIQCAQCHHHPFEKWSQDDYYGFASFFRRIGKKQGADFSSPKLFVKPSGLARHPKTGKEYQPKALDGPEFANLGPRDDPRDALAAWMRSPRIRSSPGPS